MRSLILITLFISGLSACTTTAPKPEIAAPMTLSPQPEPSPRAPKPGELRVIATLDTSPQAKVELLGVDPKAGHAQLLITQSGEPSTWTLQTYALGSGEQLEAWRATDPNAAALVGTYPRFNPISDTFEADLARYAAALRASGSWSVRSATAPHGVFASPDGAHIIYTVQAQGQGDGDWLMIADGQGKNPKRFDPNLTASYRVNYAPDSSKVAWLGGSPRYARQGQIVGYVLHISDHQGNVQAVPQVRDALRTPLWSSDSKTIFALGHQDARTQCLFAVEADTGKADALFCHLGQLDMIINPKNDRILLLLHPWGDDETTTSTIALIDPAQGKAIARYEAPKAQGYGEFGYFVSRDRVALFAQSADKLQLIDAATGKLIQEMPLGGNLIGRHNAGMASDELILLRNIDGQTQLIGVQMR